MSDGPLVFFAMVNCAIRAVLTFIIIPMLVLFPEEFKPSQRLGLSLIASGSLLTVPTLYMGRGETPFDGWAVTILTAGVVMFMWSSTLRLFRHHWNNVQQARYWERRKKGKVE